MNSKSRRSNYFGIKQGKVAELCGWYGMLALMSAYSLVSFGILEGQGVVFQLLNFSGAIGLLIVAASKGVIQLVVLNIFWALVGIVAILRL